MFNEVDTPKNYLEKFSNISKTSISRESTRVFLDNFSRKFHEIFSREKLHVAHSPYFCCSWENTIYDSNFSSDIELEDPGQHLVENVRH